MTPNAPNSEQSNVEMRVDQALQYSKENTDAKFAKVARDFGIARQWLRRFNGIPERNRPASRDNKLSPEEDIAICRYIDLLSLYAWNL